MRALRFPLPSTRVWACVAALGAAIVSLAVASPARASDPWLFVNDVHLNPTSHNREPVRRWGDTNPALLDSAIKEMQRLAPDPPVIVMAGDFLAHRMKSSDTVPTMIRLAHEFDRAFPRAQFVIALGNNDSACGDYATAPNSSFLRAVTAAWAPLVNRHGAAPDFVRTFPRDGFYTATLPFHGGRAVVVDNTFWSALYHNGCGFRGNPTPQSFGELERALRPGADERRWLVMHIPPGIDASSTINLVHHLAIVPFLRPGQRDRILELIGDPARRIELVVTGHMHRFSFRIVDGKDGRTVPLLVSPALSPILGSVPSFLSADVRADGVVHSLEEHALTENGWRDIGGLGSLGVSELSGPALVNFHRRLERDPDLRAKYSLLYTGGSTFPEIGEGNWRPFWCAMTEFGSTPYRACLDVGGFGFLTRRGLVVAGAGILAVLAVIGALVALVVVMIRRRRRTAGNAR